MRNTETWFGKSQRRMRRDGWGVQTVKGSEERNEGRGIEATEQRRDRKKHLSSWKKKGSVKKNMHTQSRCCLSLALCLLLSLLFSSPSRHKRILLFFFFNSNQDRKMTRYLYPWLEIKISPLFYFSRFTFTTFPKQDNLQGSSSSSHCKPARPRPPPAYFPPPAVHTPGWVQVYVQLTAHSEETHWRQSRKKGWGGKGDKRYTRDTRKKRRRQQPHMEHYLYKPKSWKKWISVLSSWDSVSQAMKKSILFE